MNYKTIDFNIKRLFQKLEETGILLDEGRLLSLIRGSQQRLVEQKQMINREAGFTVNLYSTDHLNKAVCKVGVENSLFVEQMLEARRISSLIRELQQIYDLANGNCRVLGRQFGLYPKYGLGVDGKIITISELSVSDLPTEILGVVNYKDKILIKATYPDIILGDIQELSGDPVIIEATATDLAKMGFVNLFEDYRIGKLGVQIFAIAEYSIYLFAPDTHIDLLLLIVRECLENTHPDFTLSVNIAVGISLDKLS